MTQWMKRIGTGDGILLLPCPRIHNFSCSSLCLPVLAFGIAYCTVSARTCVFSESSWENQQEGFGCISARGECKKAVSCGERVLLLQCYTDRCNFFLNLMCSISQYLLAHGQQHGAPNRLQMAL